LVRPQGVPLQDHSTFPASAKAFMKKKAPGILLNGLQRKNLVLKRQAKLT